MCGICGQYGPDGRAPVQRMLSCMVHRGPDDEGVHEEANVTFGMRRLSIIDIAGGHQPVANENGTVRVVQNGEIYNYRELRAALIRKGHRFSTNSDTEVTVHLYEEEGPGMVEKLRGMFALCLWDSTRQRLVLARDRLGIKPLYYLDEPARVLFASELQALRAAVPGLRVRPQAVIDYLALLYVNGPDTIYENVKELPSGSMLVLEGGQRNLRRYYDLRERARAVAGTDPGSLAERFRELLRDTVDSHLVSDVPLGLFLSGGMDSGAILAMMHEVCREPVRTFSIGYGARADAGFNETSLARSMADRFGAQHTEELVEPNATELLPAIVERLGEPFGDSSAIPTYLVSEVARRSVTVALSGVGGDELFGGYPRYLGIEMAGRLAKAPAWVRRALSAIGVLLPEKGGHRDYLSRLKRFVRTSLDPVDLQYARWVTYLPTEWLGRAFAPAVADVVDESSAIVRRREIFTEWPRQPAADKAMGLDLQTYLPDDLLKMGDRMSMAHSLELRVPFCDHELLELALAIPAAERLRGSCLKSFMRRSLEPVLPRKILKQPKRGFMVPLARWLRQDLREMVGDLLAPEVIRRRGYLRPEFVSWLIDEHTAGRRNFADQIYALLALELWWRGTERQGSAR